VSASLVTRLQAVGIARERLHLVRPTSPRCRGGRPGTGSACPSKAWLWAGSAG
jgi:hypothetical protein